MWFHGVLSSRQVFQEKFSGVYYVKLVLPAAQEVELGLHAPASLSEACRYPGNVLNPPAPMGFGLASAPTACSSRPGCVAFHSLVLGWYLKLSCCSFSVTNTPLSLIIHLGKSAALWCKQKGIPRDRVKWNICFQRLLSTFLSAQEV